MAYPALAICGTKEVNQTIDQPYQDMISIIILSDGIIRPAWITRENHLVLFLDNVIESSSTNSQTIVPRKADIQKLLAFGRKILPTQATTLEKVKVLLNCYSGRGRSPAAGHILLCDWYGSGNEEQVAKEIKKIALHCWLNPLMIQLTDIILERNGEMVRYGEFN